MSGVIICWCMYVCYASGKWQSERWSQAVHWKIRHESYLHWDSM